MPNDIVVQSDKNGGKVHLSADRVYDLNKNKTQDVINAEFEPLMQLDSEVAIIIDGRSCTLGAVSGQYVILQNSTIAGKSDGLYTVATGKTIPIGATNVTADMLANPIPRGGLNHLIESVKTTLSQLDQHMAYVESGNAASRIYTAGAFISWKGTLYKANTAIPQGTAFSAGSGGNLSSIVDGSGNPCGGLNALSNYTVIEPSGVNIIIEKSGFLVVITFNGQSPQDNLYHLSDEFMPLKNQRSVLRGVTAGNTARCSINASTGYVNVNAATSNADVYYGQVCYIAKP